MCQYRLRKKWINGLSVLTFAVFLLGTLAPSADASPDPTTSPITVRLIDNTGEAITNIVLTARFVGSDRVQSRGKEKTPGTTLMNLPSGQYYFTSDISDLYSRPAYLTNLKGRHKMMLYYISGPVNISADTKEVTLTVNNAEYIDVADIGGDMGFKMHIDQNELGINTDVNVQRGSSWVRLFLPIYKTYTIASPEGVFHLKWPVFATPGLQFVFSAT